MRMESIIIIKLIKQDDILQAVVVEKIEKLT